MEPIKLECTFEERLTKKGDGSKYKVVVIKLSDKYEKLVFLSYPEQILLESYANEVTRPSDFLS